jgi:hypothetical protein
MYFTISLSVSAVTGSIHGVFSSWGLHANIAMVGKVWCMSSLIHIEVEQVELFSTFQLCRSVTTKAQQSMACVRSGFQFPVTPCNQDVAIK